MRKMMPSLRAFMPAAGSGEIVPGTRDAGSTAGPSGHPDGVMSDVGLAKSIQQFSGYGPVAQRLDGSAH